MVSELLVGMVVATIAGCNGGGPPRHLPPETTIDDRPPAITNQTHVRITFHANGFADRFRCQLDANPMIACGSPFETDVSDGPHGLVVAAASANTVDETPASVSWRVDTVPPDTTIVEAPPALDNNPEPAFTFQGSDDQTGAITFQCALDDGEFAACTPPATVAVVDGNHRYQVRAVDAAGNPDPSPATTTWTVDTTAPDTLITSGPAAGSTTNANVTFEFRSPDPTATFECSLDTADNFAACTSPQALTLAGGSHTFAVRAKDPVGLVDPSPATRTWTVDTTPPSVTITATPSDPTNLPSGTFAFTSNDATATFKCKIDTGAFAACTSGFTSPSLADGSHTFTVQATDPVGNAATASFTWTIDTVAPTVTITAAPPPAVASSTATFSFTTAGAPVRVECSLDGGTFVACTSPRTLTGNADGVHTFVVQATDAAGNVGSDMRAWTVDTTPPVVVITSGPPNPTNDSTPSFAFTVTGATSIDCRVDGGGFAACTSPFTPAALVDGSHTVTVRGTDAVGNIGTAARTFTIDTVPPSIGLPPVPSPTNNNRPSITFTVTGATIIECQIDAGAFVACTSPFRPATALADGSHTFRARGTDAAGNVQTESTTFIVDTVAPVVTVTPVNTPTNNNRPSVAFTVTGATTIQCQVDTGTFAACTSPFTPAAALADGSHTVTVRGTDAANNIGNGSTTFTVDTVAPVVTATPVTTPTNNNRPGVAFTVTGATTIQCQVDTAAFATCTSPFTPATALADGSHTVTVRGTDAAGNIGTGATTFTVDTIPPVVTVTPVTTPINNNRPGVTFTVTGATTIQCQIDTGAFTACTSPFTPAAALAEDSHTVTVRGTDAAGNIGTGATTFTVDTVPPVVTVTPATTPTNNNRPGVTFTVTGATTIQCQIDTGAFTACTSPFTPAAALADGSHTVTVRGTDAAGNIGTGATTFTVDTTPPIVTVTPVTTPTNNNRPGVTFTVTGATTIQCQIDTGAFATCTSPFTPPAALADGSHTITVRGTDAAGNIGTGATTFTVDTVAPVVTVTAVTTPTNNNRPGVAFTVTGASTIQCQIDTGAFAACTSPFTPLAALADGSHTITVRGTDAAGNIGTGATTFTVDTTPPVVTVTPVTTPTNNNRPGVTFTVTGATTIQCRIDNGAFATCTSPFTPPAALADGSHTITVRGTDAAGNIGTGSTTFTVDTVAPVVTVTPVTTPTNNNRPPVTFTVTGATTIQCQIDAGAFAACTSPFTPATALANGSHTITVRGTDTAGNIGTGATTFTVDTVAPVVTVTPVTTPTNNNRPPVTFTVTGATTIQCQIDAGAFAACTSPFTPATALADGSHTITVRGTDTAGNIGTGSTTFTVDTVAPVVTVTAVPSPNRNNRPSVTFTVTGATTIQCQIDTAAFATCTSPFTPATALADGSHTITVRGTDAAGNVGTGSTTFTVDTVPPVVTVTPVTTPTRNNRSSVTFTVTGATTIQCQIDTGAFATCTSPFTPATALADGSHTITVRGTDAAGNVGTGSTTFTVDTVPPVVTVTAVPSPTRNNRPPVTFTVTGATTIQCQVDTAAFAACTSPFTPATALADGGHTITVRGADAAGNAGTGSTTFTVDTVAPVVTVTPVPSPTRNSRPSVTFTVTGATTIQCRIDSGAFATCTSPFTPATALADGSHTITVRGTDAAGNAGTGSTTFVVDTTPPGIVFDDAPPASWPVNYFDMKFHSTETSTTFTCSLNGAAFTACTSPRTITTVYNTASTFAVRATDAAGNVSNASRSWTSRNGLVLHYPWEQGQTLNTSLLAQKAAYSPSGSATLTPVGGWAGTAASSPAGHTYANTIRALSSSADGGYTVSIRVRLTDDAAGTVVSTIAAGTNNGFALRILNGNVFLDVKDNGTTLTTGFAVTPAKWVQLAVIATATPQRSVQLLLDAFPRGALSPQTTNGFGPGQAANLTVGPFSGGDLDDLRFYNRSMSVDELCTTVNRGELGDGSCEPLVPKIELAFEHGLVKDTGDWELSLTKPTSGQFSFVSTGLGMGMQLSANVPNFGYRGFSQISTIRGHSFSTWFAAPNTSEPVVLMGFLEDCGEGSGRGLCGFEVDVGPSALEVFVGDGTFTLQFLSIPITSGIHSLLITEQKVPDGFNTQSLSIYVDGVVTVMPLDAGDVFCCGNDTLQLGNVPGMTLDEIQFWPRDLSDDPEVLCENGLDGQWNPANGTCALVN